MPQMIFRIHAIERMFQRGISMEDVMHVLATGETIEAYPDDTPYPSRLILGRCGGGPIHAVIAENKEAGQTIVVTAYVPDTEEWERDFKRRKTK